LFLLFWYFFKAKKKSQREREKRKLEMEKMQKQQSNTPNLMEVQTEYFVLKYPYRPNHLY
jgi:hypothetical protein